MGARYGYVAVRNKLLSDIGNGVYKVGDKLPTEREMCEMFHVSRITVRQALAELQNDGWVQRTQGRGTFVQNREKKKEKKFESLLNSNYSFSTAVGLFNNVVNVTLVMLANFISKKVTKQGLF